MKKGIFGIIVGYGLIIFLFIFYHPETQEFDLRNFGGRIFNESEINPGTFTIEAPFKKAITWGKDAILSYGKTGVKIWKPDTYTSGAFLFSHIGQSQTGNLFYWYKIDIDNGIMSIKTMVHKGLALIMGCLSLMMLILIFFIVKN